MGIWWRKKSFEIRYVLPKVFSLPAECFQNIYCVASSSSIHSLHSGAAATQRVCSACPVHSTLLYLRTCYMFLDGTSNYNGDARSCTLAYLFALPNSSNSTYFIKPKVNNEKEVEDALNKRRFANK